jgi:hypothetical protein
MISVIFRKGELTMAEHENQQGHFFMGFLIGGVLGALQAFSSHQNPGKS